MDTQSTAAERRFELKEKHRRWKETYLPAGDSTATYPLDRQLKALGDERLIAAHEDAMAGLMAEKLLAAIKPVANFHFAAGLTTGLLFKRGLHHKRSLITDAPLKLWLKLLDSETLESLHHESVAACAKAKLLGQRDETAYRTNRIREATHRELEYRRTKPPEGTGTALGSQAQQSGAARLHRAVPKGRRQTRSQLVER